MTVCPMQIFHAAMISRCLTPNSWAQPNFTTTGHMYLHGQQDRLPGSLMTHDGSGLRFHLRRSYQSARSFFLPAQGADSFEFRDLQVRLLPKLAFFALWGTPVLGTPALISEYLPHKADEDNSDGEDPGGPLPGNGEMPTTSPTVPVAEMLASTNPAAIMNLDPEAPLVAIALESSICSRLPTLRRS